MTSDRFMRLPEVMKATGLSRPTIYRKMRIGTFPRAQAISANAVAWRQSAIEAWLREPMAWSEAA